jgi:hypothetical protein
MWNIFYLSSESSLLVRRKGLIVTLSPDKGREFKREV